MCMMMGADQACAFTKKADGFGRCLDDGDDCGWVDGLNGYEE